MSSLEFFFYVVLPVVLVAAGWLAVRLNEQTGGKGHHGPAE